MTDTRHHRILGVAARLAPVALLLLASCGDTTTAGPKEPAAPTGDEAVADQNTSDPIDAIGVENVSVPGATGTGAHDGHNHATEDRKPIDVAANDPKRSMAGQYGIEPDPNAKLAIEFGAEKHDFGKARQGDVLDHTFVMTSGGTADLVIRQAKPTCGCTVGQMKIENADGEMVDYKMGDPIGAGKRIELAAKLDTTSKRNQTQVRINIYSNDPVSLTQLSLAASIEPFITATPTFVNFGDVSEGAVKTQTIDVRTTQGEPVALTLDESRPIPKPQGFDLELVAVNPEADGRASHWQAKVTLGPDLKEGPLGYSMMFLTDHDMPGKKGNPDGTMPKYSINANVNARVLGVLSCTPQFLSMGLVRPGQPVPRHVKLISHDPDFDLADVKVELRGEQDKELAWAEYFSTSIKPASGMANALDIQLKLEGLPEGADGSFRGEMIIYTGHDAKPEVPVRFSGVCRAGVTRQKALVPPRKVGGR